MFDPDRTRNETGGRFSNDTNVTITSANALFFGAQAKLGTGLWESLYEDIVPLLSGGYPVSDFDKLFACKFQGQCSATPSMPCAQNSDCPATESCGNAVKCETTDPATGKKIPSDVCPCTSRPSVRDWLVGYMGLIGRPDSPIAFSFPGLQANATFADDGDMRNATTMRVGTTDTNKVAQASKRSKRS